VIVVLGGILGGIFTPTEASAIAAVGLRGLAVDGDIKAAITGLAAVEAEPDQRGPVDDQIAIVLVGAVVDDELLDVDREKQRGALHYTSLRPFARNRLTSSPLGKEK